MKSHWVVLSVVLLSSLYHEIQGKKYTVFLSKGNINGGQGTQLMDDLCDFEQTGAKAIINEGNGVLESIPEDGSFFNTLDQKIASNKESIETISVPICHLAYNDTVDPICPGVTSAWTGHSYFCGSEGEGESGDPWRQADGLHSGTVGLNRGSKTWLHGGTNPCNVSAQLFCLYDSTCTGTGNE